MSGKQGWLDLFDLFYDPTKKAGKYQNEPGSFAFVILFVLILVFGLFAVFNYEGDPDSPRQKVPSSTGRGTSDTTPAAYQRRFPIPHLERCRVERCVDGDTLVVVSREGYERVRLIGSNTPETVRPNSPVEPFGPEATDFTRKRIEETKNQVVLEADGDLIDKYGRRLALVWLGKESTVLLNEELIRNGLARAETQYNYSRAIKDRFITAQQRAQSEKLGIWSLAISPGNKSDRSVNHVPQKSSNTESKRK